MSTPTFRLVAVAALSLLLASWLPASTLCSHVPAAADHSGVAAHAHDDGASDEPAAPDDCSSAASIGCGASLVVLARAIVMPHIEMQTALACPPLLLHDRLQPRTIFRPPIA